MAVDVLWRLVFVAGHRVLRVWWWLSRPATEGAYVLVRRSLGPGGPDEVLLIRNSYKPGFNVPSGGIRRGEETREAARRELAEEVGLEVAPERLEPLGDVTLAYFHRRDRAHFFELALREGERPALRIDRREVTWAAFVPRASALQLDLVPHVRERLSRSGA